MISSILDDHKIDILGLSETKLGADFADTELHIPNYQMYRRDRTANGGGVAIYILKNLRSERLLQLDDNEIEAVWIKIFLKGETYQIGTIYRPPSEAVSYWQKLDDCLESLLPTSTVIMGDFNADSLNLADTGWKHLELILSSHGLKNFIHGPTRITPNRQSCLDLLLSNIEAPPICEVVKTHIDISDHQLLVRSEAFARKVITYFCSSRLEKFQCQPI